MVNLNFLKNAANQARGQFENLRAGIPNNPWDQLRQKADQFLGPQIVIPQPPGWNAIRQKIDQTLPQVTQQVGDVFSQLGTTARQAETFANQPHNIQNTPLQPVLQKVSQFQPFNSNFLPPQVQPFKNVTLGNISELFAPSSEYQSAVKKTGGKPFVLPWEAPKYGLTPQESQAMEAEQWNMIAGLSPVRPVSKLTAKLSPILEGTLNKIRLAIDAGDSSEAKALYLKIPKTPGIPTFQTLVDEVSGTQQAVLGQANNAIREHSPFGNYQDVITKMQNFLKVAGEKKSKQTGELFREHIPRNVFGQSSDEIASSLGMTEGEFMAKISPQAGESILKNRGRNAFTNVATWDNPLLQGPVKTQTIADNLNSVKTVKDPGNLAPSLDDLAQRFGTDVKKKVGLLDYFRTPEYVLQKIGLGNEAKLLRQKYEAYLTQLPQEINKVTQWSKQVPKDSGRAIFRYLDGQGQKLNPDELKVANEIKDYLSTWADKLGLPKERRITNYITRIFDKDLVQKEFPDELAKLIRDKVPGSVYDPFTLQRLGKQGYVEDVWQALDAYVKRAVRKVNMDPALETISKAADTLETSQYNYVKKYVDRVNMRPTDWDNLLDNTIKQAIGYRFGQRPTTVISQKLRQAVYRGTLGLNPGSAIRNLTQGVNTFAKLGTKYTIKGYLQLAKQGTGELKKTGVLQDNFIQDRSLNATRKFWEGVDKKLWFFFDNAEKINRGSAYFGAKAKALDQGMNEAQAIEYAKDIVRQTQFTFGSIDTPQVLQSDIAKTLLQFQSFNIKQTEMLVNMVKNKEFAGLIRFGLASTAVLLTAGKALGLEPKDMIPFGGILTGQTKLGQTPPVKLAGDIMGTIANLPDQYGGQPTFSDRLGTFAKDFVPFIPAGVQAKKSLEALRAMQEGGSFTPSGKLRFEVQPGLQPLLFGLWNSREAKDYLQALKGQSLSDVEQNAKQFEEQQQEVGNKEKELGGRLYLELRGRSQAEKVSALQALDKQGLLTPAVLNEIKRLSKSQKQKSEGNFVKAVRMINTNAGKVKFIRSYLSPKSQAEKIIALQELDQAGLLTKDLEAKLRQK